MDSWSVFGFHQEAQNPFLDLESEFRFSQKIKRTLNLIRNQLVLIVKKQCWCVNETYLVRTVRY